MNELILHTKTKHQLELAVARDPQVLLLHGERGVGLKTIAHAIGLKVSDRHNLLEIVPDDKGSIKIDTVRQLYGQTRAKKIKKLVIIIDDADAMLSSAQNALLKLLEDTPKNTLFMLTTHHPQALLPTIRSRAQEIDVQPVSSVQTTALIKDAGTFDDQASAQLLFLAQGLPAELKRLIGDKGYREFRMERMGGAKSFLAKPLYEKLVYIYKLPNDRTAALDLLQDCMHIIRTTPRLRPATNLAVLLQDLLETEQRIRSDGHVRTQLLRLALGAPNS